MAQTVQRPLSCGAPAPATTNSAFVYSRSAPIRLTPIDGTAGRDDPNWVGAGELEYLAEAVGRRAHALLGFLQTGTLSRASRIDRTRRSRRGAERALHIHGRFGHGANCGSTESPIPEERAGPTTSFISFFDCDANVMAGGRQGACTARRSDSVNP